VLNTTNKLNNLISISYEKDIMVVLGFKYTDICFSNKNNWI